MIGKLATGCAILWAFIVCCLSVVNILAPQRNGTLALTQVFAPYLFLPLLAALALWRRSTPSGRVLRVLLISCGVLFGMRFLPGWIARPAAPDAGATALGVTSWNLELGQAEPARILDGLRAASPGFIGLVELTPRHAGPISADPDLLARFPFRSLHPLDGAAGIGLLSSYPFVGSPTFRLDPPMLVAMVDVGGGRTATVVVAHPEAAVIGHDVAGVSVTAYDPTLRDTQIRAIRARVEAPLTTGDPVLLFGDFNVTDREPGYNDMVRGLTDAQRSVGLGPGPTWRPPEIEWVPFGLLRIDMLFTGGTARPLTISPDCTPRGSDHCVLRATVEIAR